jgi:O-antigen/teichoic acid export membrane protein
MGMMVGKKNSYYVYIYLIGFMINVVLNWVGITQFGIIGAAFGTMITMILISIIALYLSHQFLPMNYELKSLTILLLLIGTSLILISIITTAPYPLKLVIKGLLLTSYTGIGIGLHPHWISIIKTKLFPKG